MIIFSVLYCIIVLELLRKILLDLPEDKHRKAIVVGTFLNHFILFLLE